MNDKISELIINLKNAGTANKEVLEVSFSKLKLAVVNVLAKEGYISGVKQKGEGIKKALVLEIAYKNDGTPKITDVKRVSKLSRRTYLGYKDLLPVKYGHGIMILSTPKGILTDKQAKKEKIGGEALFKIW